MFSKRPLLDDRHLLVDFGDCFAYKAAMPSRANQERETNMAKKTPEEVEEDRSDQAPDQSSQDLRVVPLLRARPTHSGYPGSTAVWITEGCRRKAGGPFSLPSHSLCAFQLKLSLRFTLANW